MVIALRMFSQIGLRMFAQTAILPLNAIIAALVAQEVKKEAHANNATWGLHSSYEQATWRSGVGMCRVTIFVFSLKLKPTKVINWLCKIVTYEAALKLILKSALAGCLVQNGQRYK